MPLDNEAVGDLTETEFGSLQKDELFYDRSGRLYKKVSSTEAKEIRDIDHVVHRKEKYMPCSEHGRVFI